MVATFGATADENWQRPDGAEDSWRNVAISLIDPARFLSAKAKLQQFKE
jgi:hypothetical protein